MSGRRRLKREGVIGRWRTRVASLLLAVMAFTGGGCFFDHEVEQFYGRALTPREQVFRWSDGGLPQVFDPALAAVPPDTDAVRAMFEGLTEYDSKTLAPIPGVATRWESSPDSVEWTFHLRRDARWSNNEPVTAHDFVRSWRRTLQLGDRAPFARLLRNIQGAVPVEPAPAEPANVEAEAKAAGEQGVKRDAKESKPQAPPPQPRFGAEALDDYTLRVRLLRPDPGFAALVSHPVFRPISKADEAAEAAAGGTPSATTQPLASNGAFQLSRVAGDGVVLERAKNYWDAKAVSLQRVQFVPAQSAEAALALYKAGQVDAVTNAGFEPLALKLLAPYKDFRRATFGALTFYSFNISRPPFDDVRVREALSIAIDRDRISTDELGGSTEPAKKFLPVQPGTAPADLSPTVERDVERARRLLAEAGFPGGDKFPKIRLLVNRNAQQREVAEAVAAMWRSALNIETEIILKDWGEYEIAYRAGDYDVARRSYVMQTADESTTLRDMLQPEIPPLVDTVEAASQTETPDKSGKDVTAEAKKESGVGEPAAPTPPLPLLTESQALKDLPAMPIYFASSYALVKPYVVGFDPNLLDAPSLKRVRIDTSWQQQPKQTAALWARPGE